MVLRCCPRFTSLSILLFYLSFQIGLGSSSLNGKLWAGVNKLFVAILSDIVLHKTKRDDSLGSSVK